MRGKAASKPRVEPAIRNGRRATSYDVALAAGVSQSAVSRCFAANASVAPATRTRIMKIAANLGYQPNALAQGLISGRTNIVALLISNLTTRYYPEILAELSRHLALRDIRMMLFSFSHEKEIDGVLEKIWRHSVDGVISASPLSDGQIGWFDKHRVPLILYNCTVPSRSTSSVCCDTVANENDLIGQLLNTGHKSFAIIAGPEDSYVGDAPRVAALRRLAEAGIENVPVIRGDFSYDSGRRAIHTLAGRGLLPDAVISVGDVMAVGAMDAARIDLHLAIPDSLSIIGLDGSGPAHWASYDLTSIRQPVRRMTEAAVSMLVEQIEDRTITAESRSIGGEFLPGCSARLR